IKGIASVFKERSPETRVVGLVPSGAPAMAQALKGQLWDAGASISTIADGLAVRVPIASIVEELKALVDEVWLVDDAKLLPAVRSLLELEQTLAEPSAAITVAAASDHKAELAGKRVAAIITGAHLRASLLQEALRCEGIV
ncbi:MAG: pyridoxal-phosphate dependent enzyme, partial [Chloroflexi bacterium]|nr:pyridoxal-phosphate dependent enzyme [Chloroflexota bacterium]